MIVVRVELHSAKTGEVKELARMHIANTGQHTDPKLGDYLGQVLRAPAFDKSSRYGVVEKHRRLTLTVWHLVAKMLINMGYGASGKPKK